MMLTKYFLILLLSGASFFARAQVTISDEVADYYLELDDRFKLLSIEVVDLKKINENLRKQLLLSQSITKTYVSDSSVFRGIIATKDEQLSFKDKELNLARKEIRNQKLKKWIFIIGLGFVIVEEEIRYLRK